MRVAIAVNAKVQRPGVCNAAETLLVHADVAADFLPRVLGELRERAWSCASTAAPRSLAGPLADTLGEATEEDWATEYLALILRREGGRLRRGGDRARQPLRQRATRRRS